MSAHRQIILASASPRRRALLESACFTVDVRPSRADETWPGGDPQSAVMALAQRKLGAVNLAGGLGLAADTVVMLHEEVLGKPADRPEAISTLQRLSGEVHRVVTGFCMKHQSQEYSAAVVTEVAFRQLSLDEIERYVDEDEPFDKAGSYGIQGAGGFLVDWVKGSYTNVVGLPLREVMDAMESLA
ncbi:MAG: Maf family protein [Myxococcota bacterium]